MFGNTKESPAPQNMDTYPRTDGDAQAERDSESAFAKTQIAAKEAVAPAEAVKMGGVALSDVEPPVTEQAPSQQSAAVISAEQTTPVAPEVPGTSQTEQQAMSTDTSEVSVDPNSVAL